MGSAERLGVCSKVVSIWQETRVVKFAFTLTLVDAGAGFDGDEAPTSDLAMFEGEDPLVFEFIVDACRSLGDVMCAWRLGGLWEPAGKGGCECESGLRGRLNDDDGRLLPGDE
jgi:hypothetical protein